MSSLTVRRWCTRTRHVCDCTILIIVHQIIMRVNCETETDSAGLSNSARARRRDSVRTTVYIIARRARISASQQQCDPTRPRTHLVLIATLVVACLTVWSTIVRFSMLRRRRGGGKTSTFVAVRQCQLVDRNWYMYPTTIRVWPPAQE
jgi:hypothetical protein